MTQVLPVDNQSIELAAALLRGGAVVAFPTETVYGLGANGLDAAAVLRIFAAKGRPPDNPLILHVAQPKDVEPLVRGVPKAAERLMRAFWPGPLTIILEASDRVPIEPRAGLTTVAVRCPENPWARALIARCGFPIAAPSANLSGRPSPTTAQAVLEDMDGRIPMILDGGACGVGLESTVVALRGETPVILRPGGVTAEMLRQVAGDVCIDDAVLGEVQEGEPVASPGMKYRHYAPNADLTVFTGEKHAVARRICALYDTVERAGRKPAVLCRGDTACLYGTRMVYMLGKAGNAESVGAALFETLRAMDADGCTDGFAEAVDTEGFGLAVMNRMLRAAGHHVVDVSEQADEVNH